MTLKGVGHLLRSMSPADGPGGRDGRDVTNASEGPDDTDPVQSSWPELTCWGCGPANDEGLHLESYVAEDGDTLVATVDPAATFDGGGPDVMYGGHIASLVDCHSIWAAITFAYRAEDRPLGSDPRIAYVTGDISVEFHRPTPVDRPVHLAARIAGEVDKRTTIRSEVGPEGQVTATGEVEAVRIDPSAVAGHHQG